MQRVFTFEKSFYLCFIKITNHKKLQKMKKSTYLVCFVIVALIFTSVAYIAHKIVQINGALPIDFV